MGTYDHLTLTYDHLTLTYDHLTLTYEHLMLTYDHLTVTYNNLTPTYGHLTLTYDHRKLTKWCHVLPCAICNVLCAMCYFPNATVLLLYNSRSKQNHIKRSVLYACFTRFL